jgi:hypothetical protein
MITNNVPARSARYGMANQLESLAMHQRADQKQPQTFTYRYIFSSENVSRVENHANRCFQLAIYSSRSNG